MMRFLLILIFAWSAHAQGLNLRNSAFVGVIGSGSGGASGGGGMTAPSFFWELDETSGNRVDSVASLAMVPSGTGPDFDTGQINNAFKMVAGSSQPAAALGTGGTVSLATDGSSISLVFWMKANAGSTPQYYFDVYDIADTYLGGISWFFSGTTLSVAAFNDDPFVEVSIDLTTHPVRDGNWHLIAIVWDSATGKLKYSEDAAAFTESSGTITFVNGAKGELTIRSANTNQYLTDQMGLWLDYAVTAGDLTWLNTPRQFSDF